jgi:hypothetical protein
LDQVDRGRGEYVLKEKDSRMDPREDVSSQKPGFTVTNEGDAGSESAEQREEYCEDGGGMNGWSWTERDGSDEG